METYITVCKIDSQWEFAVWLRKLKQGSVSTQRGGMGKEMGGKFKMEQICASDQIRSVAQSCPTLCDPMDSSNQASLSITNSQNLLKLMSIESVMPSNHLILCRPFLLWPSIFPRIRVFSNESVLHIRWPKYWSFKLQHQSFQ